MHIRYCDYTKFLKNKKGYLRASYAERDGYHWKLPVYAGFAKAINAYIKKVVRWRNLMWVGFWRTKIEILCFNYLRHTFICVIL